MCYLSKKSNQIHGSFGTLNNNTVQDYEILACFSAALERHHIQAGILFVQHSRSRITTWKKYLCCDFGSAAPIRISAIKIFPGQNVFVIRTDCVVMVPTHTHRRKPELRRDRTPGSCAKPFVLTMRKSLRCQKLNFSRMHGYKCQK